MRREKEENPMLFSVALTSHRALLFLSLLI
jgi:hypothetical protein